jgi:hypothetical protein
MFESENLQSYATRVFLVFAGQPRFSAVWRGCIGRFTVSVGNGDRQEAVWGLLSEKSSWASETVHTLQLSHIVQPSHQAIDRGPNGEILLVLLPI